MKGAARRGPGFPWAWLLLAAATLAATGVFAFAVARPVQVLPRMEPAPVFELTSTTGELFRSHERGGRVQIYFFAASRHADRIGKVLELMGGTARELQARGWLGRVELVLVTLDPEHDTPAVLAGLARSGSLSPFTAGAGGSDRGAAAEQPVQLLSGPPVAVKLAVGSGFGIYYAPPVRVGNRLRFDYEPAVVVVDGEGLVRARYLAVAADVDTLLRDVSLLLEEADAQGVSRLLFAGAHLFLCYVP